MPSVGIFDSGRTNADVQVAQEHLQLLRQLAEQLPGAFPQLGALTDANPAQDFFSNMAHLQMHRRTRALQRLCTVRPQTGRSCNCTMAAAAMIEKPCQGLRWAYGVLELWLKSVHLPLLVHDAPAYSSTVSSLSWSGMYEAAVHTAAVHPQQHAAKASTSEQSFRAVSSTLDTTRCCHCLV